MALLFPPEILPNVARTLFRALQAADGFGLSKDELAKSVAPTALPRRAGTPPGPGTRGFERTLTGCLVIGLFDRDGNVVRLHPDLPDSARDRRHRDEHFRSLVRDLVLRDAMNHGLWDSSEGARDLTRGLAWYLAQNPLRPPAVWNEPDGIQVVEVRQFGADGERVFSNDTRWGSFCRWATFLGFSRYLPRNGKDILVPDPTDAIRHIVPSLLTEQRQEIGIVIEELGRRVPVLDGGSYRREVESRMKPEAVRSAAGLLSSSLAHALLRLREERFIVLEDLDDAPLKVRLPAKFRLPERSGPRRTITHVSLPEKQRLGK